jgi:hypothetical protein
MQIFPRSLNRLPFVVAVVGGLATTGLVGGIWYYLTPKNFFVGYQPVQPIPYSHRLHVGQMGMDCRYCHAQVEKAAKAMIPPTQVCMGCHAMVKNDSPRLANLRKSWDTGKPVEWVHIHKLPDHAYFDHSAHVNAGGKDSGLAIGCATCHGRVDEMEVVRAEKPVGMGWCLDCHRDPGPNLRPRSELTNMAWNDPNFQADVKKVNPPQHCSGCHR